MAIEPTGERIFDPDLGKERDAFPGEIVPEDQENSFQRALRDASRPYIELYNLASQRGGLTEEQLVGVLKAAQIAADQKAKELEEAFKTNPAAIIQEVLTANLVEVGAFGPGGVFQRAIDVFDNTVERFINNYETRRRTAATQGTEPGEPLRLFAPGQELELTKILPGRDTDVITSNSIFAVLRDLGGLPIPEIENFSELLRAVPDYSYGVGRVRPPEVTIYSQRAGNQTVQVFGLASKRPELNGISFNLGINEFSRPTSPYFLDILGTPEICAKMITTAAGFKPIRPADQRRLR